MAMHVARVPEDPLVVPPFFRPPAHGERRIMHYSSLHKILLVGEGDFSFSNALATAFDDGRNIIATSLESREKVLQKYADAAASTLDNLKKLGALLFHEVDATCIATQNGFCNLAFDCIIYNFPHAGFHGSEDDKKMIKQHKQLVRLFFENAARLLRLEGEVHVSHKVKSPYSKWKLEKQAAKSGLMLKAACDFHKGDYPGYVNRRGDGSDSGRLFHLGPCKTFIFKINPAPFHPWRELSSVVGRTSRGFLHKMLGGRQVPSTSMLPRTPCLPAVHGPWNSFRETVFPAPQRIMGFAAPQSLPLALNIRSMKRQREDEAGYNDMHDWEMLEQQRFPKRGCFGFVQCSIHGDERMCMQQRAPPRPHLWLRPFEGRMPGPQRVQGMLADVRMHLPLHHSAGPAVLTSFH